MDFKSLFEKNRKFSKKNVSFKKFVPISRLFSKKLLFFKIFWRNRYVSLVKKTTVFFKFVQQFLIVYLQNRKQTKNSVFSQKFRPFTKTLHISSRNSGPVKSGITFLRLQRFVHVSDKVCKLENIDKNLFHWFSKTNIKN